MRHKQWDTPEKIGAAARQLAGMLAGWVPPAAYGVLLVPADSLGTAQVRFPVVNVDTHGLPALVMGPITERRDQTATYEVEPEQRGRLHT